MDGLTSDTTFALETQDKSMKNVVMAVKVLTLQDLMLAPSATASLATTPQSYQLPLPCRTLKLSLTALVPATSLQPDTGSQLTEVIVNRTLPALETHFKIKSPHGHDSLHNLKFDI